MPAKIKDEIEIEMVYNLLKQNMTEREISMKTGLSQSTVHRWKWILIERGILKGDEVKTYKSISSDAEQDKKPLIEWDVLNGEYHHMSEGAFNRRFKREWNSAVRRLIDSGTDLSKIRLRGEDK